MQQIQICTSSFQPDGEYFTNFASKSTNICSSSMWKTNSFTPSQNPLMSVQDYRKLHYDIKKPFHHVPVSKQVIMQKKIYY